MNDSILIVNDIAGYGKVSTATMIPILSAYGYHTYQLPTAVVSNTLDYGSFEILDLTDFMRGTISIWRELGFHFSHIATGFINSEEQVEIIMDLIEEQDHPIVFVDPIMAENGELYPGMYPNVIECNRRLAGKASLLIPNFTEATMLTGLFQGAQELTINEYQLLSDSLLDLGPESVVITSCRLKDSDEYFNIAARKGVEPKFIAYDHIDTQFIGTGDIFSSVLYSEFMKSSKLEQAVQRASDFVHRAIEYNRNNEDHFDIRFEKLLQELFEM